jgi:hypothetical protein
VDILCILACRCARDRACDDSKVLILEQLLQSCQHTLRLLTAPSPEALMAGTDLCTTVVVCLHTETKRRAGIADAVVPLSVAECYVVSGCISCLDQVRLVASPVEPEVLDNSDASFLPDFWFENARYSKQLKVHSNCPSGMRLFNMQLHAWTRPCCRCSWQRVALHMGSTVCLQCAPF